MHCRAPVRDFYGKAALLLAALVVTTATRADEVTIAVAANFLVPLRDLAAEFSRVSGHEAIVVSGSTGQLYAQIVNGAPYEILLAADSERPRLLAAAGYGVPDSVFTYAIGRLALWSRKSESIDDDTLDSLGDAAFRSFAIADPRVAPYGAAARQVLENLGIWTRVESRLVRGQNIAQAFAWVETQNADMGLVALSQALTYRGKAYYRVVPASLHEPIHQDAILLNAGAGQLAAMEFLGFLEGTEAGDIIARYGYSTLRDVN